MDDETRAETDGPDEALSDAETRRGRVLLWADANSVPLRALLVSAAIVVALYVGAKLLYLLRPIIVIFAVAGFLAVLVNPLVVAIQRRGLRRGYGVAITAVLMVLVFIGLVVGFGYPLVNGLTHLADSLPTYVKQAQNGQGWIGHLVRRYHIEHWVQANAPKLVSLAEGLAKPALAFGRGAATLLAQVVATFALVILLLAEGPKIRRVALAVAGPRFAETSTRIGHQVSAAISGYVLGDFLTSLIAGVVVAVTLSLLGVPFALLFGLWVAVVDFLPSIGGALAGVPTVLFATAHSLTAGIVTLVVFIAYTFVENHLLNPIVMSRTVKINPLVVFSAVLVGANVGVWLNGAFGGFVAILLAVPIAAIGQVIVVELWRATSGESDDDATSADEPVAEADVATPLA